MSNFLEMKDGISLAIAIICFLIIIVLLASRKKEYETSGSPSSSEEGGLANADLLTRDSQPALPYLIPKDTSVPAPTVLKSMDKFPLVGLAETWDTLPQNEKIDYLFQRYLEYDVGGKEDNAKTIKENQYIEGLPQDDSCSDDYDGCPAWAAAGECDINPEFMLYHCQASCKSCALTLQQKQNVTAIFNSRTPPACVYHGAEYPGPPPYIQKVLTYYNA